MNAKRSSIIGGVDADLLPLQPRRKRNTCVWQNLKSIPLSWTPSKRPSLRAYRLRFAQSQGSGVVCRL